MFLTLPVAYRELLGKLQSHVFSVYEEDGEFYFGFSEGILAQKLHLSTRKIAQTPLSQLFPIDTYVFWKEHLLKALSGEHTTFEVQFQEYWLMVSLEPIFNGQNVREMLGSSVDITRQKEAQHELERALHIERKMHALKKQFITTISHEFRTPLTLILSSVEMMERYGDNLHENEIMKFYSRMKVGVDQLTSIMDDFLQHAAMAELPSQFMPKPLKIVRILHTAIDSIRDRHRDRNPQIILHELDEAVCTLGDERILHHIFCDVLDNAVKYSQIPRPIDVIIQKGADVVEIKFEDRGIGIPHDEVSKLFTPYFRASNSSHSIGSGLGLSNAKDFIELHHGSITVRSKLGSGTTVIIRLPLLLENTSNENLLMYRCV